MAGEAFYITTPIYYVNGSPHIGHAYTTIAADVAARYHRMMGQDVRFLTGTDEHGQKVLEAAEKRGLAPKAHCDELVVEWKAMMERLNVQFDRFIRTTDDDHVAVVQRVLQKLFDAGEIYKGEYEGWYLVKDEIFITDKEREERIASGELSEADFKRITESNYFFRMGNYREKLLAHIEAHPDFIQPTSRRNEVLGFLKKGLGDLCISRPKSRMSWGIELPFDADFVCYVWFDALLNYLTGTGFHPDGDEAYRTWWPASYQLIGKDILTTHSVYWTTMLMAMEVPLPEHIFAHGWWVSSEGDKIGKSAGNAIDVDVLCDAFGVDAVRYFFLREIRFGADGAFSYDGFLGRYNTDLANDFGNLAHRGLSMTTKWIGTTPPERAAPDPELAQVARTSLAAYHQHLSVLSYKEALEALFELIKAGNKYIDTRQPWALNKGGQTEALAAVMRDVLEVCAVAAYALLPVLPTKAAELLAKLGLSADDADQVLATLAKGDGVLDLMSRSTGLSTGDPLFPRFREMPTQIAALFAEEDDVDDAEVPLPDIDWIEYGDFAKLQLKIGKVLEASDHPDADKLLVMKVDVGEARPRTICAGIKSVFAPEDLVGRTVVVVANLKPRKLRGIPSEGMILAASGEAVVDLVSAKAEPGNTVS
ncbi:MAG: methionine--tRNA ligase [Myxococcales bacterium]|nr:methionine--tRNA ligase [Myxococcales bacterium]